MERSIDNNILNFVLQDFIDLDKSPLLIEHKVNLKVIKNFHNQC